MQTLAEHVRDFVHVIGKLGERRFAESGMPITLKQQFLLTLVSQCDDVIQTELAEHLKLDKSAVLREIDSLEELGLIQRINDLSDRRKKFLKLTEAGKEMYLRGGGLIMKMMSELAEGITDQEMNTFLTVMTRMSTNGNNLLK